MMAGYRSLPFIIITILVVVEIQAVTYRVTTIHSKPYVLNVTNPTPRGQKFKGLFVDILQRIHDRMQDTTFVINHVSDSQFGYRKDDGSWTGMIGELLRNESDIAVAPITATALRASVVDFSHPIVDLGLRILVKKPEYKPAGLDRAGIILAPFAVGVWVAIVISYLLVSVVFFVISRFNPEEEGGQTDNSDLPITTAFFMMFSMLSLQGFRLTPTSASGRILVCFWWMFAIFTFITYTASLTSSLFLRFPSVEKPLPFYSFEQLANQSEYRFGTFKLGATYKYFEQSLGRMEKSVFKHFENHPEDLVKSTTEGIEKVRQGKYAFIMESDTAHHYAAQPPCNLHVVGEAVGDRQYVFACRKKSHICSELDAQILALHENGAIRRLTDFWMSGECGKYEDISSPVTYTPPTMDEYMAQKTVDMTSFAVPLILISIGIVISVVVMVIEIYCAGAKSTGGRSRRLPDDKRTFQDAADMET